MAPLGAQIFSRDLVGLKAPYKVGAGARVSVRGVAGASPIVSNAILSS